MKQTIELRETLMNCIPTLFGFFMFTITMIVGVTAIHTRFNNSNFYETIIIFWLFLMLHLVNKLVPSPILVYTETYYCEDEKE